MNTQRRNPPLLALAAIAMMLLFSGTLVWMLDKPLSPPIQNSTIPQEEHVEIDVPGVPLDAITGGSSPNYKPPPPTPEAIDIRIPASINQQIAAICGSGVPATRYFQAFPTRDATVLFDVGADSHLEINGPFIHHTEGWKLHGVLSRDDKTELARHIAGSIEVAINGKACHLYFEMMIHLLTEGPPRIVKDAHIIWSGPSIP